MTQFSPFVHQSPAVCALFKLTESLKTPAAAVEAEGNPFKVNKDVLLTLHVDTKATENTFVQSVCI